MSATTGSEEFLDLRQLVTKLWERRWWLIASTMVFTIAAVIFALSSERVYRATAVLAPAESSAGHNDVNSLLNQVGGLASLAGISVGAQNANIEEALAVLRSRQFTVRFFEEENVLPKLFRDDWDETAQRWKLGVTPPSHSRAFALFDAKVRRVIQNKKTGLVTLQIEWTGRIDVANWTNELVRRLNEEMRQRAIDDTNASIRYLEKELESTSVVEVNQSINRLIEAQVKQRMLANVNKEFAFRVIDKAVVPEPDEAVRPHRSRIVMIGTVLGFITGAMLMVLVDYFRRDVA